MRPKAAKRSQTKMVPKVSHRLFCLIAVLLLQGTMPLWSAADEWRADLIDGNQDEIFVTAGGVAGGSAQARAYPVSTMAAAETEVPFLRGINLPSATFGPSGGDYIYPGQDSIDYFWRKGFNLIRLGFKWENLQPRLQAPLSGDELSHIDEVICAANGRGLYVAIDPHNYMRYFGQVIGVDLPVEVFADLWARLAEHYKNNPRVIFDLMNEPNTIPTEAMKEMSQAAITAIRSAGARNLILVEGNHWSGARHWLNTGGDVLAQLSDPVGNLMLSPHQYLNSDDSGITPDCVSTSVGAERLQQITEWARSVRMRLLLGEFGAGVKKVCEAAVRGMLDYIRANTDVWAGWAWWAGGPGWRSYFSSLEPVGGVDRPQMAWLAPYLEAPRAYSLGETRDGAGCSISR
jgi:endoglucanase